MSCCETENCTERAAQVVLAATVMLRPIIAQLASTVVFEPSGVAPGAEERTGDGAVNETLYEANALVIIFKPLVITNHETKAHDPQVLRADWRVLYRVVEKVAGLERVVLRTPSMHDEQSCA